MSVHKSLHHNFIKTTPLACIIMASGKGERFGSNKLLVEFKGKPLLQHILETTSLSFAKRLVVTRYEAVVKLCHSLNIDAVLHDQPYQSDTVRIGLENLPQEDYAGFLFCTGDQPLLAQESILNLWEVFAKDPNYIYRTTFNDVPGNPIIFPAKFKDQLLNLPQDRGGSYLTKKYPEQVRYVPVQDCNELYDIDTKSDLENLLFR